MSDGGVGGVVVVNNNTSWVLLLVGAAVVPPFLSKMPPFWGRDAALSSSPGPTKGGATPLFCSSGSGRNGGFLGPLSRVRRKSVARPRPPASLRRGRMRRS